MQHLVRVVAFPGLPVYWLVFLVGSLTMTKSLRRVFIYLLYLFIELDSNYLFMLLPGAHKHWVSGKVGSISAKFDLVIYYFKCTI